MNMNRFSFCITILLILVCGWGSAQTDGNVKSRIDTVLKNHNDYIYEDVTTTDAGNALARAMDLLRQEVSFYIDGGASGVNAGIMDTLLREATQVTLPRGDKYRAFVYISKSTVDSMGKSCEKGEVQYEKVPSSSGRIVYNTARQKDSEVISGILSLSTLQELGVYLPEKQKNGDIIHYDSYRSLPDPAAYYLVVCDKYGNIVAVLSPGRDIRSNLKTHQPDKADNYKNYKIIGFRMTK